MELTFECNLNNNILIYFFNERRKRMKTKIAFDLNHAVLDGGLMNFGT